MSELEAYTIDPESTIADSCVIWLHGLGASGDDFLDLPPVFQLPSTRFVFPHAPMRPVTINEGMVMRAWYDIYTLASLDREDIAGMQDSRQRVEQLIQTQIDAGIAADRIVLAGYSQGGCMALYTGLRFADRLAGIMGLSCYLTVPQQLATEASEANRQTPVLLGHGQFDTVVPYVLGTTAHQQLVALQYPVSWHSYPIEHAISDAELQDIKNWLAERLSVVRA